MPATVVSASAGLSEGLAAAPASIVLGSTCASCLRNSTFEPLNWNAITGYLRESISMMVATKITVTQIIITAPELENMSDNKLGSKLVAGEAPIDSVRVANESGENDPSHV